MEEILTGVVPTPTGGETPLPGMGRAVTLTPFPPLERVPCKAGLRVPLRIEGISI